MSAADDLFDQGATLLRDRRFTEAAASAHEALRLFPEDGHLWHLLGTALWALGDHAAACAALETASTLAPLLPLARCALADAYLRAGRPEVARVIFHHLGEDDNCPTELLPQVARGLGELGEHARGLAVCRKLVERDPFCHTAHFGIAYYLARLGSRPEPVLAALRRAFDLAPHVRIYRLNLACLLGDVGQLEEACMLLWGIAAETISCPYWLGRMLVVFERAGEEARAQACRERLARLARCGGQHFGPSAAGETA